MHRLTAFALTWLLFASTLWGQTTTQPTPATTQATPPARSAAIIDVEGEINDFTARTFERQMEDAEKLGVETIIVRLHTPGGAVGAALEMSRLLKVKGNNVHTIAYVDEYAYSAGTLLAVACKEIVMGEHSVMGDCAPIIMGASGGLENLEGANRAKVESPLVAEFEDSAERNGHDPVLLRSFVQYQLTVYVVENSAGERKFVSKEAYESLDKNTWKLAEDVKNPIDDELTLLTINNSTAEKIGLSRGTFASLDAFVQSRGLDVVNHFRLTGGEQIVGFLSSSGVRGLLSMLFMLTLYLSFSKPGTGLPETALVVVGVLLFGVPMMTGYAGWLEIVMIILGIAFLAAELFLIPGFGLTGIAGIVLVLVGMTLTFVPSEAPALPGGEPSVLPQLEQTRDALKEGLIVVAIGLSASIFLWFWLARYLPNIPYMNRLVLNTTVGETPEPGRDAVRDAVESAWPLIGAQGTAATDLRPGGMGRFFDPIINDHRNIDVICDRGYVRAGTPIVVRSKEGTQVIVREAPASVTKEA